MLKIIRFFSCRVYMQNRMYGEFYGTLNSRRYSPVRGVIYLLKITSIYGNFTPIGGGGGGGKMVIFGYF